MDLAKPVAELAKSQKWPVKTYVFVSSGAVCVAWDCVDRMPGANQTSHPKTTRTTTHLNPQHTHPNNPTHPHNEQPPKNCKPGGMYKAGDQFPLVEEDAVSDSNDARKIEMYLAGTGLPYTFFRPQVRYKCCLVFLVFGVMCVSVCCLGCGCGCGFGYVLVCMCTCACARGGCASVH